MRKLDFLYPQAVHTVYTDHILFVVEIIRVGLIGFIIFRRVVFDQALKIGAGPAKDRFYSSFQLAFFSAEYCYRPAGYIDC